MKNSNNFEADLVTKKMELFCAYQERCHQDVENKLRSMNIGFQIKENVMLHLLENDFLNEERFAKAFARGKFRIKKWGKERIIRELKFKRISEYNIITALNEIDENEYYITFNELSIKRFSEIKESNKYKKRKKLADYLLYRGWETDMVYKKIVELIP